MAYTTKQLITLVKNRETIPESGAAYGEDVLLEFLDQALKGFIVPAIETTLEEHFVVSMDTTMPTQPPYNGVSPPTNVGNSLLIPGESTGLRLRDVYVVGTDGSFYNLPRLTPTQAASQNFGNATWSLNYNNQTNATGGFFLQGNQVQIFPYGLASGKTVRITYQRAPLDLCLVTESGQVVAIDYNTGTVTLDKVLPWKGSILWPTTATHLNVISGVEPHDFVQDSSVPTVVYTSYAPINDIVPTVVNSNFITLNPAQIANVKVGDWINVAGKSVFAMNIPKELVPVLVQKAAEMVLESAGDREGQQVANKTFLSMIGLAITQIAPRVIGKPIKILPTNSAFKASRVRGIGLR